MNLIVFIYKKLISAAFLYSSHYVCKPLYSILFLLFFTINSFAQPEIIRFKHITTDDGLSQSTIYCILKCSDGFMWFGTADGLNRYDGYEFKIYKHDPENDRSIGGNDIVTAYEDKDGNLWFGTVNSLSLYDKETDSFTNYIINDNKVEIIPPGRIKALDGPGKNIWAASTGGGFGLYDLEKGFIKKYIHDERNPNSISSSDIMDMFIDSRNRFWIATTHGLNLFNPEEESFKKWFPEKGNPRSIPGSHIRTISEDINGNIWIASYDGGLCKLIENEDGFEFLQFQHNPKKSSLSNNLIISTFMTAHGLWIGLQNGGLDYFDTEKFTFKNYSNDARDPGSLNNNSVSSIFEENNGNLWIGTYAGGINLASPVSPAFSLYQITPGDKSTLSYNSVADIFEDHAGLIWIATDGGGLNRFDRKTRQFEQFTAENTNLAKNAVLSVIEDSNGDIWIGAWKGGLNRLNKQTKQFQIYTKENAGLPTNSVFALYEDRQNRFWVNSFEDGGGLVLFNRAGGKAEKIYTVSSSNLLNPNYKTIVEDPDGNLLLGTQRGLSIFNPEKETFTNITKETHNLCDNFIMSLLVWNDSIIWIGTSNGLNRFNRNTNETKHYFEKDGLPNKTIKAMEKDETGNIWIATNKGISRFNPETESFKNFVKDDGLQGNEFNTRSSFKSKDGCIWFGGVNGFNVFNPNSFIKNTFIPPIVFTGFQIFNKTIPIQTSDSPLHKHINEINTLTLSYKESVFSFNFSALNFVSPEKNQYAYMMEGFENDWNYVGIERKATYTNLSPGNYVFRVKASNNDGIWNEDGRSIKIIITPPVWQTWWFRAITLALLLLLVYVIFRIRIQQINKRNRELSNINSRLNREIEEKHRAEEAIQKLNKELEQRVRDRTYELQSLNQELESFSYSVSHDLRAPLRSMQGFSLAILEDYRDKLDHVGQNYLERIASASHTMGQLIDDLLKLAKVTRANLKKEEINLGDLANEIILHLKQSDPERKAQIAIEKNLKTKGDKILIKLALENLLHNAWKFTSRRPSTRITLGKTVEDNHDVFFIRDNGVGFDMTYIDKIFEPFQRQHSDYEGTGIGLATVARIIKRHGGELWAESKINQGSTFYFIL